MRHTLQCMRTGLTNTCVSVHQEAILCALSGVNTLGEAFASGEGMQHPDRPGSASYSGPGELSRLSWYLVLSVIPGRVASHLRL